MKRLGRTLGVHADDINADEQVNEIREQRAQAQAAQQAAEMATMAAEAAGKGSKAPEAGSPTEVAMEAVGV